MTVKRKIQIFIDIIMTVMLPLLMAYQLIGEAAHEYMGMGMCLLFLCHHMLNWRWHGNLLKGRYNLLRIVGTTINIALFIIMAALMSSGIMMSKHIFNFGYSGGARTAHLLGSYWGFVLMSIHIGLHWNTIWMMIKRAIKTESNSMIHRVILIVVVSLGFLYGLYAFIKRQLGIYMLLQSEFVFFDFEEPVMYFIFDYTMIMCVFAGVGFYVSKLLKERKIRSKM